MSARRSGLSALILALAACGGVTPIKSDGGSAGGAGDAGGTGGPGGAAGGAAGKSDGGSAGGAGDAGGTGGPGGAAGGAAGTNATGGASPATDGGPADVPTSQDGPGGAGACNLSRSFGEPVPVPGEVNTAMDEVAPRLSADELTLYFARHAADTPGALNDIYIASRSSLTTPFGTPAPLAINTASANEMDPMVATDGLTLFFASDRAPGMGESDIYFSTRAITTVGFMAAMPVPGVNTPGTEMQPFLAAGGDLWLAYRRPGSDTALHLRRAPKTTVGFGTPVAIPELDGNADDSWPVLSADELTIYFSSARTGPDVQGKPDVWVANRATRSGNFSAPVDLVAVNTAASEYVGWVSPDGCRLYFASNRRVNTAYDIFVAAR